MFKGMCQSWLCGDIEAEMEVWAGAARACDAGGDPSELLVGDSCSGASSDGIGEWRSGRMEIRGAGRGYGFGGPLG